MTRPQRGVWRQELELPFLYLGRGGTQWRIAGTLEIEHPDSGQLDVRPTRRGQAVDALNLSQNSRLLSIRYK